MANNILEMHARDAGRMAETLLAATDIRRSSTLEERFLIDGADWTGPADGLPSLEESRYAWLPVLLLTIAAHGETNPAGAATKAWRDAADGLRRALFVECEAIAVQLVDGDEIVAERGLDAQWLPGDVLAVRRDVQSSYENLASAAQAMLGRQDLLKDLRLVLGSLSGRENPTLEQVKATTGDDPQFDLGISEIKAATRFARRRGGRWRILRVRNALSVKPEFDWLPNPFQEGFREHFRLHRGGMRVSLQAQGDLTRHDLRLSREYGMKVN